MTVQQLNYLKIKLEPQGCDFVHPQLEAAFIAFNLCAGWVLKVSGETGLMTFLSQDERGRTIKFTLLEGQKMGEVARKRYYVFLRAYLVKGKQMLADLETELQKVKRLK